MKIKFRNTVSSLLLTTLLFAACTPAQAQPTPGSAAVTSELSDSAPDAAVSSSATAATALPGLLPEDIFSGESIFCLAESSTSAFTLACEQNNLHVTQNENRHKADISLFRDYPIVTGQFSLEADVISLANENVRSDQNTFGFFFVDSTGIFQALRVQGMYFNFESGVKSAQLEIEEQLATAYSPDILFGGQHNHWNLVCNQNACEAYVNGKLAGRAPNTTNGEISAVGLFTTSTWDENFGELTFSNLSMSSEDETLSTLQPFTLADELTSDQGAFAQSGLSGAFHNFEEDGFHFSPVIPYGYYAAKTGPALKNVEVSAKVKMEIDPDRSGSQYGGLVCRSSRAGMYLAIIGVDGTYNIYRDTPARPFALLAEKSSDVILPGWQVNELKLVCEGDTISFYINGQMVETLTDTRYRLNYGRAGIYTKAGGEPQTDAIIFSDFVMSEIE